VAIIFMGTPDFAVPSLQALIEEQEDIALVVTQPDRVKGRGHALAAPPVKELAIAHGIRVIQPEKIRTPDFYAELAACNPEFIIVVAFGRILPKEILDLPARGCINVHASLLPKYRGAAPIQWALMRGEKVTGITTMLMDEGMDTGDMLLQSVVDIDEGETAGTLFRKLAGYGAKTLIETIRGVRSGTLKPGPQEGEPTFAPVLKKEDGLIDWRKSAADLENFIRGMNPWPCSFARLGGNSIKIIRARAVRGRGEPGRVEKASGGLLLVGTTEGLLAIEELQPEGKKVMTAASFLAGRKLKEGDEKFS
jgi:methionyl-tRNA formyltransferase